MYRFNDKFLVRKWDDLIEALSQDERKALSRMLMKIDSYRHTIGKKDNSYLVVNTDEPYIQEIAEILVRHGHCAKPGDEDVIEV